MISAELGQIVYVLLSNYFEASTLDYFFVSAQLQWPNAMWLRGKFWVCGLRCRSAAVSFLGSRIRIPLMAMAFVICCMLSIYRAAYSFVGVLPSVSVSNCVWSKNQTVTLTLSLAAAPQTESNVKFTYRHSNCSPRLLPAPDSAVYQSSRPFYRAHFKIIFACRRQTYLHMYTWQVR